MHVYDSEFALSLFYNLLTVIEFADYIIKPLQIIINKH